MRNLPGAEEIKQPKSALHTHSHLRALLVTQLEPLGKNTGLLMLILPREFGPTSDVISHADSEKHALPKSHEGWKRAQLNTHYVAQRQRVSMQQRVDPSARRGESSQHNPVLVRRAEVLVKMWSWVINSCGMIMIPGFKWTTLPEVRAHKCQTLSLPPLFPFFSFSFPGPDSQISSMRISARKSGWECKQLTNTHIRGLRNISLQLSSVLHLSCRWDKEDDAKAKSGKNTYK